MCAIVLTSGLALNNGRLDSTLSTERRASSGATSARQLTGILASDHGGVKDPITTW
jgi:hypothetical protein